MINTKLYVNWQLLRGTTVNRLIDEMTTLMLAEFDAETHFKLRAARGANQADRGLALLDKVI